MISSYSNIYALGHRASGPLVGVDVIVEEKVDGSQFSFCLGPDGLEFRSKGVHIFDPPDGMFARAVAAVKSIQDVLMEGYVYIGEYLQKPKHNTKQYARIPYLNIILFDIRSGPENYLSRDEKEYEARRVGLEIVPLLHSGPWTMDLVESLLGRESVLGGTTIEGVVLKPLNRDIFSSDKKLLMAKLVADDFKEAHQTNWKKTNPGKSDMVQTLIERLKTTRRWEKAVEHPRDAGALDESPKDIGPPMKEVSADVHKEEADEIKEALFKWAWPQISRGILSGFPEWYKQRLLDAMEEQCASD